MEENFGTKDGEEWVFEELFEKLDKNFFEQDFPEEAFFKEGPEDHLKKKQLMIEELENIWRKESDPVDRGYAAFYIGNLKMEIESRDFAITPDYKSSEILIKRVNLREKEKNKTNSERVSFWKINQKKDNNNFIIEKKIRSIEWKIYRNSFTREYGQKPSRIKRKIKREKFLLKEKERLEEDIKEKEKEEFLKGDN